MTDGLSDEFIRTNGCSVTRPRNMLGADLNGGFLQTLAFKPNRILIGGGGTSGTLNKLVGGYLGERQGFYHPSNPQTALSSQLNSKATIEHLECAGEKDTITTHCWLDTLEGAGDTVHLSAQAASSQQPF